MGERSKQFPIEFIYLEQKTFTSSSSSKSLRFKALIYISYLVKGFFCNDLISIHNPQESRFSNSECEEHVFTNIFQKSTLIDGKTSLN